MAMGRVEHPSDGRAARTAAARAEYSSEERKRIGRVLRAAIFEYRSR